MFEKVVIDVAADRFLIIVDRVDDSEPKDGVPLSL